MKQTELVTAISERAGIAKPEARRALQALEEVVAERIANTEKVRLGSIVQLEVKVRPPTKKRVGRNPATGEEMTIAPKPASVQLKARPLAGAKRALPTVAKARRRLAA